MLDEFAATNVQTADGSIFVRSAGSGPPILLLHGFPETHLMWQGVARRLRGSSRLWPQRLPRLDARPFALFKACHGAGACRCHAPVGLGALFGGRA